MQCHVELSADEVADPRVRDAYQYWLRIRGHKPMPSRSDIDPIDLKFCLGWTCLVEVIHEPSRRFRYRLDGSQLASLTGWDLTGRYLDAIPDEAYRDFVGMIYNRVVDNKAPVFIRNSEEWTNFGYLTESVTLPLSNDGEQVTGLLDVILPKLRPIARRAPISSETLRRWKDAL
jgi:hypothetical protein